jgi:hypothetical protein
LLPEVIKDILSGKIPLELFLETLKFEFSFNFIAAQCWIVDRIIRSAEEYLFRMTWPNNSQISSGINSLIQSRHIGIQQRKLLLLS